MPAEAGIQYPEQLPGRTGGPIASAPEYWIIRLRG
jgi:hypothetical protein